MGSHGLMKHSMWYSKYSAVLVLPSWVINDATDNIYPIQVPSCITPFTLVMFHKFSLRLGICSRTQGVLRYEAQSIYQHPQASVMKLEMIRDETWWNHGVQRKMKHV